MSISAINEQLLRAIGVGIAIVDEENLDFRFCNEKLAEWFGEPASDATLLTVFPNIDVDVLRADLAAGRPHAVELKIKPKRRTLVIALNISQALTNGHSLLVVECA
jgi:PAS domain-containing protein